jgi:hypothetical protein
MGKKKGLGYLIVGLLILTCGLYVGELVHNLVT